MGDKVLDIQTLTDRSTHSQEKRPNAFLKKSPKFDVEMLNADTSHHMRVKFGGKFPL